MIRFYHFYLQTAQRFVAHWQRGTVHCVRRCGACVGGISRRGQWRFRTAKGRQLLFCASLGLGLLLAVGMQLHAQMTFAETCADIRADTLRLHVQANSNSVADQTLKLKVRDAILAEMEAIYSAQQSAVETVPEPAQRNVLENLTENRAYIAEKGMQGIAHENAAQNRAQPTERNAQLETPLALSQQQAIALVAKSLPRLSMAAAQAVAAAGSKQSVHVYLTQMPFDTTEYQDFTLPAGEYPALRVELGAAAGKNWWCVLYPSLCMASASAKGSYETDAENELIVGDYALRFAALEWWQKISASAKEAVLT